MLPLTSILNKCRFTLLRLHGSCEAIFIAVTKLLFQCTRCTSTSPACYHYIRAILKCLDNITQRQVHRVFRQLGQLYKCGDMECKYLEYTPFRAVIMQRVHERREEDGAPKTGWKTITRATLPRDPASENHANFSLLSKVMSP